MSRPDYRAQARRRLPVPRSKDDLITHVIEHGADPVWLRPHEYIVLAREIARPLHVGAADLVFSETLKCGLKTVRMARWPR